MPGGRCGGRNEVHRTAFHRLGVGRLVKVDATRLNTELTLVNRSPTHTNRLLGQARESALECDGVGKPDQTPPALLTDTGGERIGERCGLRIGGEVSISGPTQCRIGLPAFLWPPGRFRTSPRPHPRLRSDSHAPCPGCPGRREPVRRWPYASGVLPHGCPPTPGSNPSHTRRARRTRGKIARVSSFRRWRTQLRWQRLEPTRRARLGSTISSCNENVGQTGCSPPYTATNVPSALGVLGVSVDRP
ncbi:hypothetical protein ABIB48_003011 [Arthrobacter sp. UYCu511]